MSPSPARHVLRVHFLATRLFEALFFTTTTTSSSSSSSSSSPASIPFFWLGFWFWFIAELFWCCLVLNSSSFYFVSSSLLPLLYHTLPDESLLSLSFFSLIPPFLFFSFPPFLPSSLSLSLSTMSDPEPAVPACSSSPTSVSASESTTAAALNYAFLVHSQKTLTQNLPPRVDNKLLARQKRRRTRYILIPMYLHHPHG